MHFVSACALPPPNRLGSDLPELTVQPQQMRCQFFKDRCVEWTNISLPMPRQDAQIELQSRLTLSSRLSIHDPGTFTIDHEMLSLWCVDSDPSAQQTWQQTLGLGALARHQPMPVPNLVTRADFFDGTWLVSGSGPFTTVLRRCLDAQTDVRPLPEASAPS